MLYKPQVRRIIRARRKRLDTVAIQQASEQVAAQLIYLPQLIESQHIAYYLPQEGELNPAPIIECELLQHKNFYLPVVDHEENKHLSFYSYALNDPLIPNQFGILEPEKKQISISPHELDIIFVPLVGFDKHCNRIGRGAGYYDHTFTFIKENSSDKKPLLIGLAYEFQKIPQIEPAAWDVPLDIIVTELQMYQRVISKQS